MRNEVFRLRTKKSKIETQSHAHQQKVFAPHSRRCSTNERNFLLHKDVSLCKRKFHNGTLCQLDCRSISSFHVQCIHSFYAKLRCKFVSILNAISRLNFHGAVFVLFVKRTDYRMYRSQCIGGARYNSNKNDARHINCNTEMSTEVRSRGNSFRNVEAFPELRNQVALFEQDIRNELSAATAVGLSPGTRESNWRRISFLPRI